MPQQPPNSLLRPANGLNLVRLALVGLVMLSHAHTVGRYDLSPLLFGRTIGEWGFAGLFAVSGYLVSSGRQRRAYPLYLAHRVIRLWPAFLLCLVIIAGVFAPLVYGLRWGTLDGFLTAPDDGPFIFLLVNAWLELRLTTVSGTPGIDSYGWVGNLWTVVFTVGSYAILGAVLGLHRESVRFAASSAVYLASIIAYGLLLTTPAEVAIDPRLLALLQLFPFFAGGSLVYQFRAWLRPSALLGALALVAALGVVAIDPRAGLQLAAPLLCFGLLTIANRIPIPRFLQHNDFALGFFYYSFALQVLLALGGVSEVLPDAGSYFLATVLATAPFAALSWYLAERPVLRRLRVAESSPPAALP